MHEDKTDFLGIGLISYVACVALMLIGGGTLQHWDLHIGVVLSQLLFILIPGLVLINILPKSERPTWFNNPNPKVWIWVIVATPVVAIASNAFASILVQLFSLQELGEVYAEGIDKLLRPEETWRQVLGIVSICVVAPVCEEVLFRGGILKAQRTRQSFWAAAAINGLLFSALHMNPIGLISLAVIGAFFATASRGGLWVAIIAHALLNFISGVLPLFAIESATEVDEIKLSVLLPMFAVLALVAAFCWRQLWRALEES